MTALESLTEGAQWAISYVERAADEHEALALKTGFLMQHGIIGVRVLEMAPTVYTLGPVLALSWRVQAFFKDEPAIESSELESLGARRVLLLPAMLAQLEGRS